MSIKVPVIVIVGRKGSGKDTFADYFKPALQSVLQKAYPAIGVGVQSIAYADPIKEALRAAMSIPKEVLWGPTEVKEKTQVYGKSVRHWMQWLGTEVFRDNVHPDLWVHETVRRIFKSSNFTKGWVITDCRFPNEWETTRFLLERIHSDGKDPALDGCNVSLPMLDYQCFLVKIVRPEALKSNDTHRSEALVDMLDKFNPIIVPNDSTLEVLEAHAHLLALKIKAEIAPVWIEGINA